MRLEDCFKGRILRKVDPNISMSERSMEMANQKIQRAADLNESGFFDESVVASYAAMFQAARSLLFSEGVVEKNHYCVVLYLMEKHKDDLGLDMILWLDTYRLERHQWFYGVESLGTDDEESSDALERASSFIERIEHLMTAASIKK